MNAKGNAHATTALPATCYGEAARLSRLQRQMINAFLPVLHGPSRVDPSISAASQCCYCANSCYNRLTEAQSTCRKLCLVFHTRKQTAGFKTQNLERFADSCLYYFLSRWRYRGGGGASTEIAVHRDNRPKKQLAAYPINACTNNEPASSKEQKARDILHKTPAPLLTSQILCMTASTPTTEDPLSGGASQR